MREVYVLHNFVYQVMLQNIDLTVREGLNVESNIFIKVPLILNVKLDSYICNRLVDYCAAWVGKYVIVHVDTEDDFALAEHAVIHPGLSESDLF